MINKVKNRVILTLNNYWLLNLLVLVFAIIHTINGKTISSTDNAIELFPKILTLKTYNDWSSRLANNDKLSPHSSANLVAQESQEVQTVDYGVNPFTPLTTTQTTTDDMRQSMVNEFQKRNITNANDMNAHNIAAEVLSRYLQINPLLTRRSDLHNSTASYNDLSRLNKMADNSPSIDSLNEIDSDSNDPLQRKSASGISFPTIATPTESTVSMFETTVTPVSTQDMQNMQEDDDEEEHHHHNHEDDDESVPNDENDDYEDDEETESFRYPVSVSYDSDEDHSPDRELLPPFIIPNIDLNPESLKQKGCRTIVKEVQTIPKQPENNSPILDQKPGVVRIKRSSDPNSRKYTSIVMTKECHFPDDEKAGPTEQTSQQTVPTLMSGSAPDTAYQTPSPMFFDEYDEDFDFKPSYPGSDMIDRLEPKSSMHRKSYADNPLFRRDNDEYVPPKDNDFDDQEFYDFDDSKRRRPRRPKRPPTPEKSPKNKHSMRSSDEYDIEDDNFGPLPPKRKQESRGTYGSRKGGAKRPPLYRNDRNNGRRKQKISGGGGGGRKKPKKINKSFAFFRKAEPKEKDPNESDFSVSYGRGNFQSFSDSYDSDRDGPRNKGKGKRRQSKRYN